jgi:hypothetical protein
MNPLKAIAGLVFAAIISLAGLVVTQVVSQVVLRQLPHWARRLAALITLVAAVIAPRGRDLRAAWRAELEEAQVRGALGLRLAAGYVAASARMRRPTRLSLPTIFRVAAFSCFVGAEVGVLVLGTTVTDGVPLPSGLVGARVPGGMAFWLLAELLAPSQRRTKADPLPTKKIIFQLTNNADAPIHVTFHSDVMKRLALAGTSAWTSGASGVLAVGPAVASGTAGLRGVLGVAAAGHAVSSGSAG